MKTRLERYRERVAHSFPRCRHREFCRSGTGLLRKTAPALVRYRPDATTLEKTGWEAEPTNNLSPSCGMLLYGPELLRQQLVHAVRERLAVPVEGKTNFVTS